MNSSETVVHSLSSNNQSFRTILVNLTVWSLLSHVSNVDGLLEGYVVNMCRDAKVQQMFCSAGTLHAIKDGQIYTGPSCSVLRDQQTIVFDKVLETNGLVQSAFFDKHRNLYLLNGQNNLILVHYQEQAQEKLYTSSELIVQFEQPIAYFSYSDSLSALFVVTKDHFLHVFNTHIITSRSEVRWGINRTHVKAAYIKELDIDYFFFVGNDVIIKPSHSNKLARFEKVLDCTKRSSDYSYFAECLRTHRESGDCTDLKWQIQTCSNIKYVIMGLLLLFLLILLLILLFCCCIYRSFRQRGKVWDAARKEDQLRKKLLRKYGRADPKLLKNPEDILGLFSKHKVGKDMNNNNNNINNEDYVISKPAALDTESTESMFSSINVEDFNENRPNIDLNDPTLPGHKAKKLPSFKPR